MAPRISGFDAGGSAARFAASITVFRRRSAEKRIPWTQPAQRLSGRAHITRPATQSATPGRRRSVRSNSDPQQIGRSCQRHTPLTLTFQHVPQSICPVSSCVSAASGGCNGYRVFLTRRRSIGMTPPSVASRDEKAEELNGDYFIKQTLCHKVGCARRHSRMDAKQCNIIKTRLCGIQGRDVPWRRRNG
jgi:hypothetical protein